MERPISLEKDGKTIFIRACAQCHGGALHPSTSTSDFTLVRPIAVRYHNIQTACPRPGVDGFLACPERLNRNARTYQITPVTGPIPNDLGPWAIATHGDNRGPWRNGPYVFP